MAINEVNAELLGLYLLLITYGVYLVVFYQCILTFRRKSVEGNSASLWLQAASWLIFVIATFHLVTSCIRAWEAFSYKPGGISTAVQVFRGVASLPALLKNASYIAQTILTDAIMVYRTYVVWGQNLTVIVIPTVILCADIAIGTWSMWTLARTGVNGDPIVAEVVIRVKYFYVVTLALNFICAALIAWRIWRLESESRRITNTNAKEGRDVQINDGMPLGRVINLIVESAAIYCACLVVVIVTSAITSDVMFAVLDFMPHLMAIIFSLIIVRAARGRKYPKVQTSILGSLQFVRRTQITTVRLGRDDIGTHEEGSGTMQEVRVDLERGHLHSDYHSNYQPDSSGSLIIAEPKKHEADETA